MSIDLRNGRILNSKDELEKEASAERKDRFESSRLEGGDIKKKLSWRAPEYELYEKSAAWYLGAGLFILAIAAYAIYTNSPIMAITFILIGVVGYIYLQKDPEEVEFSITYEGIRVGRELYVFEDIKSFWIFYDPPHTKTLSLHVDASMMPYVHIPIADEDPVEIREALLGFIPEVKQEPSLIDALARFLHI